ncbi:MAG: Ig-like domain-containing protein, partial [Limisphaerales bacterium]
MKSYFSKFTASFVFFSGLMMSAGFAQTRPTLAIENFSPTQLKLQWNSQNGTDYQPDWTQAIDPFSLWLPLGNPITASDTNAQVTFDKPTNSITFYRLRVLPDDGLPVVRIISPTNGEVSGLVGVSVGAADDSRLSAVSLYLDGLPLETKAEGDLVFYFDSSHYQNGNHELFALALDNAGISYLGGNPDSIVTANQTTSATITLNFQNVLRWIDAPQLFASSVFINAQSDIFPTNYTVFVEDENGSTVTNFTGQTS